MIAAIPRGRWFIVVSIFLAVLLMLVSLPEVISWYRPNWVLMVLIFWTMVLPHRVGVLSAWCTGLLLDLLYGGLLGQQAFLFAVVIYVVYKMQRRLIVFPVWQQALWVGVLVFFYQLFNFWFLALDGAMPYTWRYWLPVLTAALFWPLVKTVLSHYRYYFAVS